MINEDLAKKIVDQLAQYTDYNINIMNKNGYIVASTDTERIGQFHDVAYCIMKGNQDSIETYEEDAFSDVKPGINMALYAEREKNGVVGITGNPDEVRAIAQIIKMSIEVMFRYEKQLLEHQKKQDYKKRFVEIMLGEEHKNENLLRNLAEQLNYSEKPIRIPVLCVFKLEKADVFVSLLKQKYACTYDITYILDPKRVIVFMSVSEEMVFEDSTIFQNHIQEMINYFEKKGICLKCIIGSFQQKFSDYYFAYDHCRWLENKNRNDNDKNICMFYDYIDEYMRGDVPIQSRYSAFNVYNSLLKENFKEGYVEIIGSLIAANWNLAEASKALFMHKNTLVYRFNKIREKFNCNPIFSARDRAFMIAYYYYLIMQNKR